MYATLREIWQGLTGGNNTDLSAVLDIKPQHSSQFATGTGRRRPSWSLLMKLCQMTGRKIVASPKQFVIMPDPDSPLMRASEVRITDEQTIFTVGTVSERPS